MPLRKRKEPRNSQRMARGSTKKRARLRGTVRPWQILTLVLCGLTGIVLALVWGNHLKAQSDAYRDQEALGDWTVEQRVEDPDGCFSQFHYTGGMWIFLGEHVTQAPQAPTIHFSVTKTE